ncbi:hypothetical protein ACS0TY_034551 [Phlomoides rotata]
MQSAKEKAANAAASAKAGMDKSKATMQEKGERMTTRDPLQKDMATEKKVERVDDAELQKQAAESQNTATSRRRPAVELLAAQGLGTALATRSERVVGSCNNEA